MHFDVGIVGAGPAGAWAAYRLACAGARVAIVDGSHPREKPCGGGVSARALAVLAPLGARLPPAIDVSAARFSVPDRGAAVPLRHDAAHAPALLVASRRELDGALLDGARAAGADHIARRVASFARTDRGWSIVTDTSRLSASWLIGADGANSLVRGMLLRPFSRAELSVASGYFVRDRTGADIDIEFTSSPPGPPGYLWSFPRPDHLAVGVCGQAHETTSAALLAAASRWIDCHAPGAARARYSWPIPSLTERAITRERPAGDRWMLIGDAAGLVDPITREGIFFALQSADFACSSISGRDSAASYLRALRSHVYPELRKAARMKTRFFSSSFNRLLIAGLQRSERIRRIMAALISGQQTYTGLRRQLLLTGELRLAVEYVKLGLRTR